jgi:hypothetical protein
MFTVGLSPLTQHNTQAIGTTLHRLVWPNRDTIRQDFPMRPADYASETVAVKTVERIKRHIQESSSYRVLLVTLAKQVGLSPNIVGMASLVDGRIPSSVARGPCVAMWLLPSVFQMEEAGQDTRREIIAQLLRDLIHTHTQFTGHAWTLVRPQSPLLKVWRHSPLARLQFAVNPQPGDYSRADGIAESRHLLVSTKTLEEVRQS